MNTGSPSPALLTPGTSSSMQGHPGSCAVWTTSLPPSTQCQEPPSVANTDVPRHHECPLEDRSPAEPSIDYQTSHLLALSCMEAQATDLGRGSISTNLKKMCMHRFLFPLKIKIASVHPPEGGGWGQIFPNLTGSMVSFYPNFVTNSPRTSVSKSSRWG